MDYVIQPTVMPSHNYIGAMTAPITVTAPVIAARLFTHFCHNRNSLSMTVSSYSI